LSGGKGSRCTSKTERRETEGNTGVRRIANHKHGLLKRVFSKAVPGKAGRGIERKKTKKGGLFTSSLIRQTRKVPRRRGKKPGRILCPPKMKNGRRVTKEAQALRQDPTEKRRNPSLDEDGRPGLILGLYVVVRLGRK